VNGDCARRVRRRVIFINRLFDRIIAEEHQA